MTYVQLQFIAILIEVQERRENLQEGTEKYISLIKIKMQKIKRFNNHDGWFKSLQVRKTEGHADMDGSG